MSGRNLRVPANLVGSAQQIAPLLRQLQPLLAAAVGDTAVQGHVAVVRLCGLVDGKLGLLGSEESEGGIKGEDGEEQWEEKRKSREQKNG